MKKLLTNNIGWKLLSVIIAFLLWLVVVSVDDPIMTRSYTQVPVELTNTETVTEQKQVYEVEDGAGLITVMVTAKRSVLDSLSRDYFKATADMSKLEGNLVPIDVKATRYSDRIESITPKTRNLKVTVEDLRETQFTIQAEITGEPAEGCIAGDVTLDKNVVKVSGPESQVERIEQALVSVNVSGMSGDISTSEDIILLDAAGDIVPTEELTLSRTSVNILVEILEEKEVPVTYGYVGTPAEGFAASGVTSCSPSVVCLAGRKDVLSKISSVEIPAELVDITGATGDITREVSLESCLPEGTQLAGGDVVVSIMVGILPYSSKIVEVPSSNITAVNVPEGYAATIGGLGEYVAVEVKGLGDAYDSLSAESILGTVDVGSISFTPEEVKEGHLYTCPVAFTFPEGVVGGNNNVIMNVVLRTVEGGDGQGDKAQSDASASQNAADESQQSDD